MIAALLVGLAVGFSLSIPPGPISIAVMRQALEGKYSAGLKIGLGAATMDTIYSLVAIFASSKFVMVLKDLVTGNLWVMLLFQALCIGTLVVLGVRYFNLRANAEAVAASEQRELAHETRIHNKGYTSDYVMGIFMSITNLASPTFIPSLIAVASYMHGQGLVDNSVGESCLYAVGFGSGAAAWFLIVLRTVFKLRSKISSSFVSRLYQFAGWSFVVFAVILAVNIVINTQWSKL